MNKRYKIGIGLLTTMLAGTALPAMAADLGLTPVILLPDTPSQTATPEETCSVCAVLIKYTATDTESSTSRSISTRTLEITYDRADLFEGDIELTVWLDTEERRTLWISEITLEGGEATQFDIQAGTDWTWDEVRFAWTKLYPTP